MNTIEHLGDAIDPNAPRYPAPRAWQDPEEPPPEEPEVREDEAVEDEVFTDRPPLKPSDVKRFAEQDKQESDKIHPPVSVVWQRSAALDVVLRRLRWIGITLAWVNWDEVQISLMKNMGGILSYLAY